MANALAVVSDEQLRARYNPDEMMRLEIYPEVWDREAPEEETLGYLMHYLGQLRTG